MNILDVIKALLNNGRITEICPAVQGKIEYRVSVPDENMNGAHRSIGHITEKQWGDMVSKGIIRYYATNEGYKSGKTINFYKLNIKENDS